MHISESEHDEFLAHYGILRKSGRYPWGSGETQNQRNRSFLDTISQHKRDGMSEGQIAKSYDMSIADLRALKSVATNEQRQSRISMAERLHEKGYSNVAIGKRMGVPESTVRNLLAPGAKDKADALLATANTLRKEVDEKGFIDVGTGIENHLGVTSTRLDTALAVLREEGYEVHRFRDPQVASGHETNKIVLCRPGTTQKEAWMNRNNVVLPGAVSKDYGHSFTAMQPPMQLHPDRLKIRYKEEGGGEADGTIYVRPGVDDISLGGNRYAQVRVAVGPTHYIKGMALYRDDLPDGVDIEFHTNKSNTGNKLDALKPNEKGANPFGTVVDQIVDQPGHPDAKVTSVMNLVNEEGDWAKWSRTLSSQMLSKQSPSLAKKQLDLTFDKRMTDFEDIQGLTNATVRRKLLKDFSDATDSASVHLKAAQMPRQAVHVILPIHDMKPNEIYAPNYTPGETVVLIRHPHGGKFEIPELTVNNNHPTAKKLLGATTRDAIGIHHSVAQHLSGADFDGDTVLVIPNNERRIKTKAPLAGLKNFDPVHSYPGYEGMKVMGNTQAQMGEISNLITDMTLKQAPEHEIERAVRHSMVVIDAEKKKLNYKQSAADNGIRALKEKYQGSARGGADTLISKSRREVRVPERKERSQKVGGPIDRETGKRVFEPTNRRKANGDLRETKTTLLAETHDAHTLSSGTPMESLYADHSNRLKALADRARLEMVNTPTPRMSASAKRAYAPQVKTLNAKLDLAERNRPLERQAQTIANATISAQKAANPNMDKKFEKKLRFQAQEEARIRVGAKKKEIEITPEEWAAIQAGAISNHKLNAILEHANMDKVREYATPKRTKAMTPGKIARAKDMADLGYSQSMIAAQLGVSVSTLNDALNGRED